MEGVVQIMLSQPVILACEIVIALVLIFLIVWVSKKRKQTKAVKTAMHEQRAKKVLDDMLVNQRRRN